MRKIKLYFVLTILVSLVSSCADDFLDRKKPAESSIDAFYIDAQDAEMAIIATYAPMQLPYYVAPLMLPDFMSEDGLKGSTYGDNSLHWNEMAEFQGLASARILAWKWDMLFEIVFKANLVLYYVPNIEMDEIRKEQIMGEAYFLRAYQYFDAAISWGNVPIILEPLEDYYVPNNTTEEVWAQVESDLKEAIDLLPEKSEWSANQIGRATKGAATALLGKAYLYQEKYELAEPTLKTVVESPEYSLDPDFAHMLSLEGENGSGSLFEINFAALGEDDVTNAEGNFIVKFQGPRDVTGWGFNQATFTMLDEFGYYEVDAESIDSITNYGLDGADMAAIATKVNGLGGSVYNTHKELEADLATVLTEAEQTDYNQIIFRSAFKATDPRFFDTFLFLGQTVDGVYIDPDIATDDYSGIFNKKVFMANMPAIWRLAPINERLIRLADVYLLYAEAAAQNNNLPEAKNYLNSVRQRVSTTEFPLADFPNYSNADGTQYQDNQADVLEAIANERRMELTFEHHRFFDIVRTGKGEEILGDMGYVEGIHNLWPIPQGDIDRAGGVLKQNEGY